MKEKFFKLIMIVCFLALPTLAQAEFECTRLRGVYLEKAMAIGKATVGFPLFVAGVLPDFAIAISSGSYIEFFSAPGASLMESASRNNLVANLCSKQLDLDSGADELLDLATENKIDQ